MSNWLVKAMRTPPSNSSSNKKSMLKLIMEVQEYNGVFFIVETNTDTPGVLISYGSTEDEAWDKAIEQAYKDVPVSPREKKVKAEKEQRRYHPYELMMVARGSGVEERYVGVPFNLRGNTNYTRVVEKSIETKNPQLVKDYIALCIRVQEELYTFGE